MNFEEFFTIRLIVFLNNSKSWISLTQMDQKINKDESLYHGHEP